MFVRYPEAMHSVLALEAIFDTCKMAVIKPNFYLLNYGYHPLIKHFESSVGVTLVQLW